MPILDDTITVDDSIGDNEDVDVTDDEYHDAAEPMDDDDFFSQSDIVSRYYKTMNVISYAEKLLRIVKYSSGPVSSPSCPMISVTRPWRESSSGRSLETDTDSPGPSSSQAA